jgi:hypothetical protein
MLSDFGKYHIEAPDHFGYQSILRMLILLFSEHEVSFHLFVVSSISVQCFIFTSLVEFITKYFIFNVIIFFLFEIVQKVSNFCIR